MGYRVVLVATDGSPPAVAAVHEAVRLALAFGARLIVAGSDELSVRGAVDTAEGLGVTDVGSRLLTGEPAGALRAAAEDDGAELLVMGARGGTDAAGPEGHKQGPAGPEGHKQGPAGPEGHKQGPPRPLGRVANEVSHHAPCDLLLVVPTV